MTAYYNEWDAQAAAWLRELIKNGHIADGVVDERDIKEVEPADLREFTQCHFFAGIGGWSVALRLAGWADDRPVWTGSPPCQPFSVAGRGKGIEDDRHIAPVWLNLVKECRPAILFGEQVAAATSKDGWLDSLQDALETEGYATGAAVLPACSVNAPHIRQRLWFTGRLENTDTVGRGRWGERYCGTEKDGQTAQDQAERSGGSGGLADPRLQRSQKRQIKTEGSQQYSETSGLADTASIRHATTQDGRSIGAQQEKGRLLKSEGACSHGGLANTNSSGLQRHGGLEQQHGEEGRKESIGLRSQSSDFGGLAYTYDGRPETIQRQGDTRAFDGSNNQRSWVGFEHGKSDCGLADTESARAWKNQRGLWKEHGNGCKNGTTYAPEAQWGNPDWLWCRDGKWRPVEPSTFPLAHGIPARVGRLRGYGNAIVPQVAAEVIQVVMEYCDD